MNSRNSAVETRQLGRTGPRLSPLGFGCMGLIGWYGQRDDAEARACLLEAIGDGITHLDTAASYQNGANEQFIGTTLATLPGRRHEIFIATKYGITRGPNSELLIDNAPASLRAACDRSLKNLATDYVDLYYLHRIDQRVPIEESVGELKRLVEAGKIRHIGLSECSVATLRRAHAVHPVTAVQTEYSLWSREPEQGMLDACRELAVGFVAYSPLGRGFLAGNFRGTDELPANDVRRAQPRFSSENGAHNLKITDALLKVASQRGCSVAQLALAWVWSAGEHVFSIPGMKRRTHLHDNLTALTLSLDATERSALSAIIDQLGIRGERHLPAMMQVIDR